MAGNAGSYVVPQVEIHQIFSQIPAALAQTQVAFVFGPNYQLHRFSDAAEKAKIDFAHYSWEGDKDSSMVSGTYPGALDPEKVDKSYTKLFGDRVVVGLADLGPATPVVKGVEETKRDGGIICVVSEPRDIPPIERTGVFGGVYHVLGGALSPLEGIGPDDLHVAELMARLGSEDVREVVLATNPNVEGETTASYLARLIKPLGVKVTRLASGLPGGGDLGFADEVTLGRALEARREL